MGYMKMSYRNFRSESHSFTNFLHFITPELDYDPHTQLYQETFIPAYPPSQKFVNEIYLNLSIVDTINKDYNWNVLVKDKKIRPSLEIGYVATVKKLLRELPHCLKCVLKQVWKDCLLSKRYTYSSQINGFLKKNETIFQWTADQRMDIESLTYLTFQIFRKYLDNMKHLEFTGFNGFIPPLEFQSLKTYKVYLIKNDDLDLLEFEILIKLLKKLTYNEISNQMYCSSINYTIDVLDLTNNGYNKSTIKKSNESDDKGMELIFILTELNNQMIQFQEVQYLNKIN